MNDGAERQALARAHEADDTGDLAEIVIRLLAGARATRLDPDALTGLTGAALALGGNSRAVYLAGSRDEAARFGDDTEFLAELAEAEDEIAIRLRAVERLATEAAGLLAAACAALAAARRELAAAHGMPLGRPCTGCHPAKAAAIAAAEAHIAEARRRIVLCDDALDVLAPLDARLRHALARIRAVPGDLGETYESVYRLLRHGGVMPYDGDWLAGQGPRSAAG